MAAFREQPAARLGGLAVTEVHDYKTHEIRALGTGRARSRPCPSPSGDLLIFHTEAPGTRFAARPSGTEPKIKFYLFARTHRRRPAATGLAERQGDRPRRGLTGWRRHRTIHPRGTGDLIDRPR